MLDRLQWILKTYTRSFVAQGIGIIGLLWCLFDDHPRFAFGLTVLVLIDQAVFLRERFAARDTDAVWQTVLHVWCLAVSLADILILFGAFFQAEGVRQVGAAEPARDPLDALAFSLASFAHLDVALAAATASGRLLAALEGLIGWVVLMTAGAWLVARFLWSRWFAAPVEVSEPVTEEGEAG